MSRLFISFSSEDEPARLELGRELERQGLKAYDYSIPHEGDQVGLVIEEQLRQKINEAPFFISLISSASTAPFKHIVHGEVAHALKSTDLLSRNRLVCVVLRGQYPGTGKDCGPPNYFRIQKSQIHDFNGSFPEFRLRISGIQPEGAGCHLVSCVREEDSWPAIYYEQNLFFEPAVWECLLGSLPPTPAAALRPLARKNSWLGIFGELQGRTWPHVEALKPGCFDRVVKMICNRLGISYNRPVAPDSRLPFYEQMHAEIHGMPLHDSVSVLGQMDYFESQIMVGAWDDALVHIRALRSLLRQQKADSRFAQVIEGVCLLRLQRPDEALKVYDRLMSEPDENACFGRAKALAAMGRAAESLRAAREGVEICINKRDPAVLARQEWITLAVESERHAPAEVLADVAWRAEVERANSFAENFFSQAASSLAAEDRVKLESLKVHWLLLRQREAEALACLERLISEPMTPEPVFIKPSAFEGFPAQVDNQLFAHLADVGLYLDSPLDDRAAARGLVRVLAEGTPESFHLLEKDRLYFFRHVGGSRYSINYLDKALVITHHELLWKGLAESDKPGRWRCLRELEARLPFFRDLHLTRFFIRRCCEAGEIELAWQVFLRGREWFGSDPYFLQDGIFIAQACEDWEAARLLALESADAARAQLFQCAPVAEWTPRELLEAWTQARELLEDEAGTKALRTLLSAI